MINLNFIYLLSFLFFCFVHPMIGWIPGADEYFSFLIPFFPLITGLSILFVVLAGYNLRVSIHRSLVSKKIKWGPEISGLIKTFLFFLFVDSLKQALVVRPILFYQWSVLQTIFLSLIIILLLSLISTRLVWTAVVLIYFTAQPITKLLSSYIQPTEVNIPLFNEFHYYSLSLCALIFCYLVARIAKTRLTVKQKLVSASLIFSIFLFSVAKIISYLSISPEDLSIIKSFWLGALIPDPTFHHSYPLTIWFPIVASGFLMADVLLNIPKPELFTKIMGVLGLIGLLILNFSYYQEIKLEPLTVLGYVQNLLTHDLWSSLFIYMICLFSFSLFFSKLFWKRFPVIDRLGSLVSGGMVYIFIFTTAVGKVVCTALQKELGLPYSQLTATTVLFFIGLGVGFVVEILFKNKYELILKKKP